MKQILFVVMCAALLTASPVQAAVIHVNAANSTGMEDGTESYPYNTIQEGIDAANSGIDWENADVVLVQQGIYYGAIVLKHHVKLVGTDPGMTIIDGSGVLGPTIQGPHDSATPNPHCWIEGFTIQNSPNTAIRILNRVSYWQRTLWEVRNCYFRDNFEAIYTAMGSGLNVQNCLFTGGNTLNEDGVRSIWSAGGLTITNATFDNFNGYPIWIIQNYSEQRLTNTILSNVDYLFKASGTTLLSNNNNFWNYNHYNTFDNPSLPFVLEDSNSISVNPEYVDSSTRDYNLQSTSPCIDAGLDVGLPYNGDAPDIGAFEFDQITLEDGLEALAASFSDLSPEAFKSSNEKRRDAFLNKIEAIFNQQEIASRETNINRKRGVLNGMRQKLEHDLLAKCDGNNGGNPADDWIVDDEEKNNFYNEILNLINIVDQEMVALGG